MRECRSHYLQPSFPFRPAGRRTAQAGRLCYLETIFQTRAEPAGGPNLREQLFAIAKLDRFLRIACCLRVQESTVEAVMVSPGAGMKPVARLWVGFAFAHDFKIRFLFLRDSSLQLKPYPCSRDEASPLPFTKGAGNLRWHCVRVTGQGIRDRCALLVVFMLLQESSPRLWLCSARAAQAAG